MQVIVRRPVEDVKKAIKLLTEHSDEKQLSGLSAEVSTIIFIFTFLH